MIDGIQNEGPDLGRLARTIGDASRIRMLTLLIEGRALTAKELAYGAGVEPATATAHLRRLEEDGFITVRPEGRHKYFRLASEDVARLVESLMAMAPPMRKRPGAGLDDPLRVARYCYDHLAGKLGTGLTRVLVGRGLICVEGEAFRVTNKGAAWFANFGLDLDALRRQRRKFAYPCLDWSEREDHLAGALGAAFAHRLVDLGWITRRKHSRVVALSDQGRESLARDFGLSFE